MIAWARAELGIDLDRWQRRALNRALATGPDGRLVHRAYLVSTGRQNGKTAIVRALIGWALTAAELPAWAFMLGLAHDRQQARIPYLAVRDDLGAMAKRYPGRLALTRYLGIRSLMPQHHRPPGSVLRSYDTASRDARNAIRGYSVDVAVLDEVRTQRDWETWAALEPTMLARPDPLAFLISSAGDDRAIVLRALWDRGLRIIGGAPGLGFGMTWYAAPEDAEPDDRAGWRLANPAIVDGRILEATLAGSLETMPADVFRREHLNLWTSGGDEWLPAGVWARQAGPAPMIRARTVLGVDLSPTWGRATIAVAVPTDAGAWVGVVAELVPAVGSVAPASIATALSAAVAAWHPELVAYSSMAAIAAHVAAWAEAADVATMPLHGGQLRAASEAFRAELVGRRLTHADDPLLAAQADAARPSSAIAAGSWYFSVRTAAGDVDAIRAAAWAAWALLAPESEPTVPQVFV